MLYTRSSFIKWLRGKDCELMPVSGTVMKVSNGIASAFIFLNNKDVIDYEEIYIVCKKIYLELPGDKDLKKIE